MIGRLFFIFLLFLFCPFTTIAQNNDYKIDDELYHYFVKVENNLKNKTVGLQMIDTLLHRAQKKKDLKAQCMALFLRVSYFGNQDEPDKCYEEFIRVSPFLLKTPYLEYYFTSWSVAIICFIENNKKAEAMAETSKMLEKAKQMNSGYGQMVVYRLQGDFYFNADIYHLALYQYRKVLQQGLKYNVQNLYDVYINLARCCYYLDRWEEAEGYLFKSMQIKTGETDSMYPNMLLLSIYCSDDKQDSAKIEKTYKKVQELHAKYHLINDQQNLYYDCMFTYYRYYLHDAKKAQKYVVPSHSYRNDSVTYYHKLAQEYEQKKDYKLAAEYIKKYCDAIYEKNLEGEKFLVKDLTVKQKYVDAQHQKELLIQKQAKLMLNQSINATTLIALQNERNKDLLSQSINEGSLLQNELNAKELVWKEREQKIAEERNKAKQNKEIAKLDTKRDYWRMVFICLVLLLVSVSMIVYLYYSSRRRKKLKEKKERAVKSEWMKSLFFQNMNHEIRSPLNAIIGFNEILNKSDISMSVEERHEFINMIETNSDLLVRLVSDVLDLSNFEGGSYKLALADVEINHFCKTVAASMQRQLNTDVRMVFKANPAGPYILHTDPQRLQQILTNYLSNACKYTEHGVITLSYEVLPKMVRFAVTDTGIGVKDEDSEKIFQRFQMLEKSKRGTGLGLHICRLIANLLHGRSYLDTQYKGGAKFVFDHPLKGIIAFLIAILSFSLPMQAQHNIYKISDNLYSYQLKVENHLYAPEALLMADTLFVRAQRSGDVAAQCLALYDKVKYYFNTHNEKEILKAFDKAKKLCLSAGQYRILLSSWGAVIDYYIFSKQIDEALRQMESLQQMAKKINKPYGYTIYFYEKGNYYALQNQFSSALSAYFQALKYKGGFERNIYSMISQCYLILTDFQSAKLYAQKMGPFCESSFQKAIAMIMEAQNCCFLKDEPNAKTLVHKIEKIHQANPSLMNKNLYYTLLLYYYTLIEKDEKKALEAQLAAGVTINPGNYGDYYYQKKDYERSLSEYKKTANNFSKWFRTDASERFESYISDLDYNEVVKERDRLVISNYQLQLKASKDRERLLSLQKKKTEFHLRQEKLKARQNRVNVSLQNVKLSQQMRKWDSQHIQKYQKGLKDEGQQWILSSLFILLCLFMLGIFFCVFTMRRKENLLRKDALDAEKAERSKNLFFENINEKMRVPLNTIIDLNKALNETTNNNYSEEERTAMMKKLTQSSVYLNTLVSNVLDISKIESGMYKPRITTVRVDVLCYSIIDELKPFVPKDVALSFQKSAESDRYPCLLQTDEQRLYYVLYNFLNDACRRTSTGIITLSYTILSDLIRFMVTDNGDAIPKGEMDNLFSRDMSQECCRNKDLTNYIISLIADILHGKVYYDTSYKDGNRFVFEQPLVFNSEIQNMNSDKMDLSLPV